MSAERRGTVLAFKQTQSFPEEYVKVSEVLGLPGKFDLPVEIAVTTAGIVIDVVGDALQDYYLDPSNNNPLLTEIEPSIWGQVYSKLGNPSVVADIGERIDSAISALPITDEEKSQNVRAAEELLTDLLGPIVAKVADAEVARFDPLLAENAKAHSEIKQVLDVFRFDFEEMPASAETKAVPATPTRRPSIATRTFATVAVGTIVSTLAVNSAAAENSKPTIAKASNNSSDSVKDSSRVLNLDKVVKLPSRINGGQVVQLPYIMGVTPNTVAPIPNASIDNIPPVVYVDDKKSDSTSPTPEVATLPLPAEQTPAPSTDTPSSSTTNTANTVPDAVTQQPTDTIPQTSIDKSSVVENNADAKDVKDTLRPEIGTVMTHLDKAIQTGNMNALAIHPDDVFASKDPFNPKKMLKLAIPKDVSKEVAVKTTLMNAVLANDSDMIELLKQTYNLDSMPEDKRIIVNAVFKTSFTSEGEKSLSDDQKKVITLLLMDINGQLIDAADTQIEARDKAYEAYQLKKEIQAQTPDAAPRHSKEITQKKATIKALTERITDARARSNYHGKYTPSQIAEIIYDKTANSPIPNAPFVILAQLLQESGTKEDIDSSAGAQGIAQFMPGTWDFVAKKLNFPEGTQPTEAKYAIIAQVFYMNRLYSDAVRENKKDTLNSDSLSTALMAYNWGFNSIREYADDPGNGGRIPGKANIGDTYERNGVTKHVPAQAVNYPVKILSITNSLMQRAKKYEVASKPRISTLHDLPRHAGSRNTTEAIVAAAKPGESMYGPDDPCSSIVGNVRALCVAEKYFNIRYGTNAPGYKERWSRRWNVETITSSGGHNPEHWILNNEPGSSNDFIECSGFVAVAFAGAFNNPSVDTCSAGFLSDKNNFKEIDPHDVQPGDLLIASRHCGGDQGGHVAIVKSYNKATGHLVTYESSAGRNIHGEKKSGEYHGRKIGKDFFYAVRYVGVGSSYDVSH